MRTVQHRQQNKLEHRAYFLDAQGEAAIPATVHWRLTNTEGKAVVDWQTATVVTTTGDLGATESAYADIMVPPSAFSEAGSYILLIVANKDSIEEHSEELGVKVYRVVGR